MRNDTFRPAALLLACVCATFAADAPSRPELSREIRAILKKAPKGKNYQAEFDQILAYGDKSVPVLAEIYADTRVDWNERWIAAMALARYRAPEAQRALEKGLKDSFPTIRMASAKALGFMGSAASAPLLRKALGDEAMVVRSAVAQALGRLKDEGSVPALAKELGAKRNFNQGKSFWVREDIIDALGAIGSTQAVPALRQALGEKEENIRGRGCKALAKIDPKAAKKMKSPTGKACAEEWLKTLGSS